MTPDLFRDSPARIAEAYRQAAASELVNPYYTTAERQARHDYYAAMATEGAGNE